MKLRGYQIELLNELMSSCTNDLVQLDTGAGKTAIEAELAKKFEYCLIAAHRNILITQISAQLAIFDIYHDTISSEYTRRQCARGHQQFGVHILSDSTVRVCSIDTLVSHKKRNRLNIDTEKNWLVIIDEAHHVLTENKWGELRKIFKTARIIGFTATPARLDGKSLSVKDGGLFDRLVQSSVLKRDSVKTLIENGYLSEFKVYAPPANERSEKKIDSITLFGDPVTTYKRIARGKRAVMMCPSVLNAKDFSEEFKKSGVSSAYISSYQPASEISRILRYFERGDIDVVCNVDMLGEGFDMPEIECIIIANTTQSLVRYRQWVGRVLRVLKTKKIAIIIDHVGVVAQHGMPDSNIDWNIDAKNLCVKSFSHVPCKKCGLYFSVENMTCDNCGAENTYSRSSESGDYFINVNKIDFTLLEKYRYEKKLKEELIFPYVRSCGLLGLKIDKLRKWFIENLKTAGIPVLEINKFLASDSYKNQNFWLENFKNGDETNGTLKVKKVYKKWLQQN